MLYRSRWFSAAALAVLAGLCALPMAAQSPKKRVAVLDFDYATVQGAVQALFNTNADIGKGISTLLVNQLVQDGNYAVIERAQLDKILAEQNFSNSDRADNASAAKLAKILGVDAVIVGSITQFGRDDRSLGVGGFGGKFDKLDRFGLGGIRKNDSKAVVQVTARLIHTDTAEILAVANAKGESKRSGASYQGAGGGGGAAGGGGVDIGRGNFGNTIIGEAVTAAVADLGQQLGTQAGRVPTRVVAVDGLVADVTGSSITINVGSRGGVKAGDRLMVSRAGKEIRDPATGRVLRRTGERLGELVITEADDISAVGTFTGSGAPKVGDSVKNQ